MDPRPTHSLVHLDTGGASTSLSLLHDAVSLCAHLMMSGEEAKDDDAVMERCFSLAKELITFDQCHLAFQLVNALPPSHLTQGISFVFSNVIGAEDDDGARVLLDLWSAMETSKAIDDDDDDDDDDRPSFRVEWEKLVHEFGEQKAFEVLDTLARVCDPRGRTKIRSIAESLSIGSMEPREESSDETTERSVGDEVGMEGITLVDGGGGDDGDVDAMKDDAHRCEPVDDSLDPCCIEDRFLIFEEKQKPESASLRSSIGDHYGLLMEADVDGDVSSNSPSQSHRSPGNLIDGGKQVDKGKSPLRSHSSGTHVYRSREERLKRLEKEAERIARESIWARHADDPSNGTRDTPTAATPSGRDPLEGPLLAQRRHHVELRDSAPSHSMVEWGGLSSSSSEDDDDAVDEVVEEADPSTLGNARGVHPRGSSTIGRMHGYSSRALEDSADEESPPSGGIGRNGASVWTRDVRRGGGGGGGGVHQRPLLRSGSSTLKRPLGRDPAAAINGVWEVERHAARQWRRSTLRGGGSVACGVAGHVPAFIGASSNAIHDESSSSSSSIFSSSSSSSRPQHVHHHLHHHRSGVALGGSLGLGGVGFVPMVESRPDLIVRSVFGSEAALAKDTFCHRIVALYGCADAEAQDLPCVSLSSSPDRCFAREFRFMLRCFCPLRPESYRYEESSAGYKVSEISQIHRSRWWRGEMQDTEFKSELQSSPQGTTLVRFSGDKSTRQRAFVCGIHLRGQVKMWKFRQELNFLIAEGRPYRSIVDLLHAFTHTHGYPITDALPPRRLDGGSTPAPPSHKPRYARLERRETAPGMMRRSGGSRNSGVLRRGPRMPRAQGADTNATDSAEPMDRAGSEMVWQGVSSRSDEAHAISAQWKAAETFGKSVASREETSSRMNREEQEEGGRDVNEKDPLEEDGEDDERCMDEEMGKSMGEEEVGKSIVEDEVGKSIVDDVDDQQDIQFDDDELLVRRQSASSSSLLPIDDDEDDDDGGQRIYANRLLGDPFLDQLDDELLRIFDTSSALSWTVFEEVMVREHLVESEARPSSHRHFLQFRRDVRMLRPMVKDPFSPTPRVLRDRYEDLLRCFGPIKNTHYAGGEEGACVPPLEHVIRDDTPGYHVWEIAMILRQRWWRGEIDDTSFRNELRDMEDGSLLVRLSSDRRTANRAFVIAIKVDGEVQPWKFPQKENMIIAFGKPYRSLLTVVEYFAFSRGFPLQDAYLPEWRGRPYEKEEEGDEMTDVEDGKGGDDEDGKGGDDEEVIDDEDGNGGDDEEVIDVEDGNGGDDEEAIDVEDGKESNDGDEEEEDALDIEEDGTE